jgi:hypothetical protein
MNNLELSMSLATAPSGAFEELRQRPRIWFPFLVVVLTSAAIVYWYYSAVDIEWLKDAMFGNDPNMQKLPEAERAAAMTMMSRNTLLWGSVIGTLFFVPFAFLLQSTYLLLAAKVTKLPQGFKHWFSLSCWTALPVVLSAVVSAILLILSDNSQVSPSVLQPLSLNELALHRPVGSPGYSMFASLSIPGVLSWILMTIGIRVWSQRSWAFSAGIVGLQIFIVYGIWAIFAFR